MKSLTNFIILLALIFGRATAFGDDLWRETQDLNNLTTPAFSEQARLSNQLARIDMWVETPDLNSNDDAVDLFEGKTVVTSGLASAELYAETPDLNKASSAKSALLSPDDNMVADR
jgi:hypothetical protein